MGHYSHHAIVVTGDADDVEVAYRKATELFSPLLSGQYVALANGFRTFIIPPDGSKEGRDTSNEYDAKRRRYVQWLTKNTRLHLSWAEIQYGDEHGDNLILRHSGEEVETQNLNTDRRAAVQATKTRI